jgi:hypothetical protein
MLELRLPSERPGTSARSSFSFTVAKVRPAGCLPDGAGVIKADRNQHGGPRRAQVLCERPLILSVSMASGFRDRVAVWARQYQSSIGT